VRDFFFSIRVTWFTRAILVAVSYTTQEFRYDVKIFGFTIRSNSPEYLEKIKKIQQKKEEKNKIESSKEEDAGEDAPIEGSLAEGATGKETSEKKAPVEAGREKEASEEKAPVEEGTGEEVPEEKAPAEEGKEKEVSEEKVPAVEGTEKEVPKEDTSEKEDAAKGASKEKTSGEAASREQSPLTKLSESIEQLKKEIDTLSKDIDEVKRLFEKLHGEALIRKAFSLYNKLLRHLFPRGITGHMHFGFHDPRFTGYLTGFMATLYPLYGRQFSVEPDFLEACFDADCQGKGLIRPAYIIYLAIWLLSDKDIRRLIRWRLKRSR
jgi:hypothetical protein